MPAGVGGQMLQTLPLYIFLLFYPIMPYRFFFSLRFRPLFFFFFLNEMVSRRQMRIGFLGRGDDLWA